MVLEVELYATHVSISLLRKRYKIKLSVQTKKTSKNPKNAHDTSVKNTLAFEYEFTLNLYRVSQKEAEYH